MSFLQSILDTARAERSQQRVLLVGSEGTGRTRLLSQFAAVRVDVGRGALLPQTLLALLGTTGDDTALLQALAAAPALQNVEPDRAAVAVELLASLLGIRRADFRTAKLDEDSRREGAALELARWIVDRALSAPLIIAFDDSHLADDEGVAFLEALSQREEPAPLVLVVSFDSAAERQTAAFRSRRDAWLADKRWRRVEHKAPPAEELEKSLTALGATADQARAIVKAANGNPGLATALWPYVRDGSKLADLPVTHDGLRLLRVKALGNDVLRACATLGGLGGVAPLPALASVDTNLPESLTLASEAGLVDLQTHGPYRVARLIDQRLKPALSQVLSQGLILGARLAAGAWAVQALEELSAENFSRLASYLVPLATPALDGLTASLWDEAWAFTRGGRSETIARLESALRTATGVRRLVLLRRIAEVKLFLGLPDEAIATIASAGKPQQVRSELPDMAVGRVLETQLTHVLDRWDRLSVDEAVAALEVVRAECVSYLVKKDETQRAYVELEKRLLKLTGAAVPHLWIRWAKGWSWFLCEILGRAADAMKACAQVRRQVSDEVLAGDEDAIAFVRAEEIATSSIGDFSRARQLTDEHIALAEKAGRLRDACLGWNARAIVHYGQGELSQARKAFERSLELARSTGWLRREAITLHNLTLVLTEMDELELAATFESTYARLSVLVGNHAGKAEAPLVLAAVELARGKLKEADTLIQQARKVAEANGWNMLVAWSRALTGRLRLLKYKSGGDVLEVTKAKNDLLAAIEVFEEHSLAWTEEIDPGEVFAEYALALKWSGQSKQARDVIDKALSKLPKENVVSRQHLEVASAAVGGQSMDVALKWFEDNQFKRRAAMWRRL
ncbi:MAG: AAA family ATPase [Archangium sp.]